MRSLRELVGGHLEGVGQLDHRGPRGPGAAYARRGLTGLRAPAPASGRFRRIAGLKSLVRRARNLGLSRRCPICRARLRRFEEFRGRQAAACPVCGSLERHRHLWLYLERRGLARGVVLHIAPDPGTEAALRRRRDVDYAAGDLEGARGGQRLDLTRLPQADGSVDLLLASHVLEHIEDDRAAFEEIHRVLRPGGQALLQVPMYDGPTLEDSSVRTPEGRREAFGQEDHVRFYGHDLPDRIAASGLTCRVVVFRDELTERERCRSGLVHAAAADPDADHLWTIVCAVRP